ncbi:MAG: hypothetical protein M3Q69_10885 [Acidobacteriota bacterium]|nr:hypothetical protein [Acidobacteriota bacterium]
MKRFLFTVALAFLSLQPLAAEETTKPVRYTWIATSCETWNCAAAALVLAGGDKYVIAIPTGVDERPWVVLRRVESGSIYIPDDEPFALDKFDSVSEATSFFNAMDGCRAPMIMNTPDHSAVVTALRNCNSLKRRAVR